MVSRFPGTRPDEILDYMQSSMEHVERAVGVPWRKDFAIVVVDPTTREAADHTWNFITDHTGLGPALPHELAHDYFSVYHDGKWMRKGTADFLQQDPFSRPDAWIQARFQALLRGCPSVYGHIGDANESQMAYFRDLAIESHASSGLDEYCEYTIGEAFWLGMYLAMGRETVSTYLGAI